MDAAGANLFAAESCSRPRRTGVESMGGTDDRSLGERRMTLLTERGSHPSVWHERDKCPLVTDIICV